MSVSAPGASQAAISLAASDVSGEEIPCAAWSICQLACCTNVPVALRSGDAQMAGQAGSPRLNLQSWAGSAR